MKLYYSDLLSARKACAVARYLKASVEFVYLDPAKGEHKTPAYVALNPNAKVPTLIKGDRITWEADAIMCQLSDDMGADLWPHDSRIDRYCSLVQLEHAAFHPRGRRALFREHPSRSDFA